MANIIYRADTSNPLTTEQVDGNFKELKQMGHLAFPYKAEDEPIVIVATGQSNCVAVWPLDVFSPINGTAPIADRWFPNPDVYNWCSDGSNANFMFRSQDSTTPAKGDWPSQQADSSVYVGYREGGVGSIGIACARKLNELTGRKVYLIEVSANGRPISYWAENATADIYLRNAVSAAFASSHLSGIVSKVDVFLWIQGESNSVPGSASVYGETEINEVTAQGYADSFDVMRKRYEGLFLEKNKSQVILHQYAQQRIDASLVVTNMSYRFSKNTEYILHQSDDYTHIVSTSGLPALDVYGHFGPMELVDIGFRAAKIAIKGPGNGTKNGIIVDHAGLQGLSTGDPHPQYLLTTNLASQIGSDIYAKSQTAAADSLYYSVKNRLLVQSPYTDNSTKFSTTSPSVHIGTTALVVATVAAITGRVTVANNAYMRFESHTSKVADFVIDTIDASSLVLINTSKNLSIFAAQDTTTPETETLKIGVGSEASLEIGNPVSTDKKQMVFLAGAEYNEGVDIGPVKTQVIIGQGNRDSGIHIRCPDDGTSRISFGTGAAKQTSQNALVYTENTTNLNWNGALSLTSIKPATYTSPVLIDASGGLSASTANSRHQATVSLVVNTPNTVQYGFDTFYSPNANTASQVGIPYEIIARCVGKCTSANRLTYITEQRVMYELYDTRGSTAVNDPSFGAANKITFSNLADTVLTADSLIGFLYGLPFLSNAGEVGEDWTFVWTITASAI